MGGGRVAGAALSPSVSTAVYVREERSALIRSDARAVTDPAALAEVGRLPVVAGDVRDLDDRSIWRQGLTVAPTGRGRLSAAR
ncbi:hypothetical protein [Streptomyces flavidovirens]|uniref:Uncharacterized protein n=1 Tax=Streptomyces flavidovirens TaxID=67298 RepID=A0ABW6RDR4_9ACTN